MRSLACVCLVGLLMGCKAIPTSPEYECLENGALYITVPWDGKEEGEIFNEINFFCNHRVKVRVEVQRR